MEKSVPNHPGKPLHPRAYIGKKKVLQTILASLKHLPNEEEWVYLGREGEGAGYFHSPGQSKGFGTSEHPICMKLLPDYF